MYYKDLIYSDHALTRIKQRGLDIDQVWQTVKYPDYSPKTKKGSQSYKKSFGDFMITVIATQNDKYEYILVSVWRDPPLEGTADFKKTQNWNEYRKAGILGKLWITIKQQLGL